MFTFLSSPPVTMTRPDVGPIARHVTLALWATNSSIKQQTIFTIYSILFCSEGLILSYHLILIHSAKKHTSMTHIFLKKWLTPYKADQSLKGIELEEKEKEGKQVGTLTKKSFKMNGFISIPESKQFRSQLKTFCERMVPETRCTRKETIQEHPYNI